ncbi:hypothetical protein CERSUDRAFT_99724 [Gelatoporia subvermispora B]|uniref:Uncharacterized protein n=1 Tax=Ceriporiopsis subvermispora (strain B) TaxID=914234 RepID=M2P9C0_CERS8|nr:hypothetical protein CERSUDRAFT_99724 [Gelatoporia subvermispora B]
MVQTRASNAKKHLGLVDLPKSKRSSEQVAANKEAKAAQQAEVKKVKLQGKKDIAVLEDEIADEDERDDNEDVPRPKRRRSTRNASKNTKKTVHEDEQEVVEEVSCPTQRGHKPVTKKVGRTTNKTEQSDNEEAVPKRRGRKPAAKNPREKTSAAAKKSAAAAKGKGGGKGGAQGKAKGSKGKGKAKAKTLPVQEDSEEEEGEDESAGSGCESSDIEVEEEEESADKENETRKSDKGKGKKSKVEKVSIRDEIEALRKPKRRVVYIDSDSDNDASSALHDDQRGKRAERSTAITIQGSVASLLAAPTTTKFRSAEAAPARSQKASSHKVSDKNSETVPPAGRLVSKVNLWNDDEYPDPPPLVRRRGKTGVANAVDEDAGTSPTGIYSGRGSKVAKTTTNSKGQNKKRPSDDVVSDAAVESGPVKKLKPSADMEDASAETPPNAVASRKRGPIETDSDDNEESVQRGGNKRPRSDAPTPSQTIDLVGVSQPDHSESNDEALINEDAHVSSTAAPYKVSIAPKSDDEPTRIFDDDDEEIERLAVLNGPEQVLGARVTSSTMVSVQRKKTTMLTGLNVVSQPAVKPTASAATAPAAPTAKSAAPAAKSTAPTAKSTAYTTKSTASSATPNGSKGSEGEDAESSPAVDDQQVTAFGNTHQTDDEVCDKDHAIAADHHSDNAAEANTSLEQSTSGRRRKRASGQGSDPNGHSNEKPNSKSTKITMQMLPDQLQKKSSWKWFAGSLEHWGATKTNPFALDDYEFCEGAQTIWAAMYGNRGPSITLRCPLVQMAKQRFGAYKNAMASSALVELNAYFDRYKGFEERYGRFASMAERAQYADECIKTASFIYEEYEVADGTKRIKGAFRNPILMRVLSNHYNRVDGWIYESPFIDLEERPMGALALAVAALERALTLYVSKRVLFVNGKNGDLTHAADIDPRKVPKHGDVKTRPTTLKAVRGTTGTMTTHDLDFSGDNYAGATEGWAREIKALSYRQLDAIFEYAMHIHKGFDDPPAVQKPVVPKMRNIIVSEDEDGDRDGDGDGYWYGC